MPVPPEERPRKRCTRANAWGYEDGNETSRVWINAKSGGTLYECLCASDIDMEDYDVQDALVNLYVDAHAVLGPASISPSYFV